jgi:putative transposase
MPRQARVRSDSGMYHVMLRGINKQRIFHEPVDYQCFLDALRAYRDICGFQLYAWCLMPNHVHLLIGESSQGETISQIMKRIGAKYVYWYNLRYERVGPLFQDRFKSEAVKDDAHFLTVLRYIHHNPLKAGFPGGLSDYPHSSYASYLAENPACPIDTSKLFSLISKSEFENWHLQSDDQVCLDLNEKIAARGITDERALIIMNKVAGTANAEDFQKLPETKQSKAITRMRKSGASLRQISRLSGISMARVRKMLVV